MVQRENRCVNAFFCVFLVDVCHLLRENCFQITTGKMRYILLLSANITHYSCNTSRKKFADCPLKMARPRPAQTPKSTRLNKNCPRTTSLVVVRGRFLSAQGFIAAGRVRRCVSSLFTPSTRPSRRKRKALSSLVSSPTSSFSTKYSHHPKRNHQRCVRRRYHQVR